jgi:hypothetical protein
MSQYKTNACITIFPFGDVAVDVEVTIDLATETVAIEDVTVQGAHLEWKCIFFAGGVPFADFVAETLNEKADIHVGGFASALEDMKGEAKREYRRG